MPAPRETAIAIRNQKQSPLLRLAPKVHNAIYEHVLGGKEIGFCYAVGRKNDHRDSHVCVIQRDSRKDWHSARGLLDLLLVSRQIYTEAAMLPFLHNDFGGEALRLLNILPRLFRGYDRIRAITRIRIVLNSSDVGGYLPGTRNVTDHVTFMRHVEDLLIALGELPALQLIVVEWTDEMPSNVWGAFKERLIGQIWFWFSKTALEDSDIKIEVIGSNDKNAWAKPERV
ncbi:hypothetical protein EK21DRAFT_106618 [Setomelanomma holmii]|uniref:DUF7730 domain-containing protein n=1 Tax=Setomelanomma holmii TaxID=210430 RepID=A0A9P4LUI0_9PLEO|nr:hypothetical protein EK21DRAFT_106618 [Setomelanomma holmii]